MNPSRLDRRELIVGGGAAATMAVAALAACGSDSKSRASASASAASVAPASTATAAPVTDAVAPAITAKSVFGGLSKLVAKEGRMTELMDFLFFDTQESSSESGTLRFDVLPVSLEPNAVLLYEVFESEAAFQVHFNGAADQNYFAKIEPNLIESSSEIVPFGTFTILMSD